MLYGWTKTEACGQTSHALLKTQFPEPLEQIERQLRETGRWSGDVIHSAKDGRQLVVHSRWLGQREERGEIAEVLESNIDVTEQKRMEGEAAWLASFPLVNPEPIVEADLEGRVHFANPAAQCLFPDIQQRGSDHPWLADWQAVAGAFRQGETTLPGARC